MKKRRSNTQLSTSTGLKWLLNALFIGILITFATPASAQLIAEVFDTYESGLLSITGSAGGWYLPAGASTSASVVSYTFFKSFPNSVYFTSQFNAETKRTGLPATASGTISFWFKGTPDNGLNSESLKINILEGSLSSPNISLSFNCGGNCSAYEPQVQASINGGTYTIGSFSTSTDFHFLNIDFTTSTARYTLDNGTPSGWETLPLNFTGAIKTISFYGGNQAGKWRLWVDNFGGYYSGTSCGENALCGNCLSITACENAGCYWLNDTCFWFPTSPASNFLGYYASNSSFATPTTLVLNWVDFAKPFIETLGNWTSAFQENFNIASATESGLNLGLVIPQAKGYLGFIEDFLGGLPLGEFFIILLTFLILIIAFRVIHKISTLIKP